MAGDRRHALDELLDEAIGLSPAERRAFIDSTADEDLREELRSLVAAYDASAGYFEDLAGRAVLPALAAVAAEPEADLPPGHIVSHYRIERRIADGGMGVVYEARDLTLDRTVALKCLPAHLHGDPRATRRLLAEARAASKLDHPHVGTVHEAGETEDGRVFIAMARYEGETLAQRIRRGPLPPADALQVARQIASGLAAAHAKGIVHRDVKPSNIVITRGGTAKLLDFGIASMADGTASVHGAAPGTLPYMSPEQTRGEHVDRRSDIWSLGIVLHEMLAGERPFRGPDEEAILQAIRNDPYVTEQTPTGGVSSALAGVISRCLEKQPDRRYENADDLVADLKAAGVAVEPRAGGPLLGRQRLVAATLAITVVTLLAGIVRLDRAPATALADAAAGPPPVWLAVLPLTPARPDAGIDGLAQPLTGELIAELAANPGLRVTGRGSAMQYAGVSGDLAAAFGRLGVDALLTGHVEFADDSLRLSLELAGSATDQPVWSRAIEGRMDQMPAVLRQIAREVSEALGVPARDPREPARTSPAYELYLRGRYHLERRNEDGAKRARAAFLEATVADITYAPAWAGLSDAMALLAWLSVLAPEDAYPVSEAAADRALDRDPFLADAHVSKARVLLRHRFDIRQACDRLDEAIELNRSHAEARQEYAVCLRIQHRFDDAIEQAEIAASLEPLSPWHRVEVGISHYMADDYSAAMSQYQRALNVWPDFAPAYFFIALVHVQEERFDEALASLDRATPSRMWKDAAAVRGYVHAVTGNEDDAREQLRLLTRPENVDASLPWYAALIHLGLGDRGRTLDLLEEAFEARAWQMPLLFVEPFLDPLRQEPRFIALLDRMLQ
jgi:TolB-like protein/Tfp pilus assembly protein PilF